MHLDLVNLLAVMALALIGGRLAARFGYPGVLGELLVGIIAGPALLGLVELTPALNVLAELGVLMMMLYIGMEVDPRELKRASWAGLVAAVGGFFAPFLLCFMLARSWGSDLVGSLFLGIAAGVTALAVNSRILVDLDIMDSRLAHVLMAAALLTDTVCLIALAAVLGAGDAEGLAALDGVGLLNTAVRAVAFFAVVGLALRFLLPRVGGTLQRLLGGELGGRTTGFTVALLTAVGVALLAELVGLHGLVGAFIAGMFLREQVLGRKLAAHLRVVVHDASIGFLAPIFFVTTGFQVSFDALEGELGKLALLILLATGGKVLGTAGAYLLTGRGWREGLVLGAAMNGRGAVEIIVAGIALDAGIIDAGLFSILVLLAMLTTALVPPCLRWGVAWLRSRGELVSGRAGREGIVVVGAGPTAMALARALAGGSEGSLSEAGPPLDRRSLVIVDSSPQRCEELRAEGWEVLHGDGMEPAVLESAGAAQARLLIAITPNPSLNALVARLARREFGVPEVHAAQADLDDAAIMLRHTGAHVLFGEALPVARWDGRLAEGIVGVSEVDPHRLGDGPQDGRMLPLVLHGPSGARLYRADAVEPGDRALVLQPLHPPLSLSVPA